MADELNTGGGASIDGRVNTNGGDFAGRDDRGNRTQISIGAQNAIDDIHTDLRLLSGEVGNLKFEQFDMRSQIVALQREQRAPEAPTALIDEQRRTNELLRLLVTLLSVLIGGSTIGGVIWIMVTVLR